MNTIILRSNHSKFYTSRLSAMT